MINKSNRKILKLASVITYEHHEKYNGTGYPRGLKGDEISIHGRILALADVFDALASDRVYKKAWELEKVLEFIKSEKGQHFDPRLVDIFFDHLNEFLDIRHKYDDVKQQDGLLLQPVLQ